MNDEEGSGINVPADWVAALFVFLRATREICGLVETGAVDANLDVTAMRTALDTWLDTVGAALSADGENYDELVEEYDTTLGALVAAVCAAAQKRSDYGDFGYQGHCGIVSDDAGAGGDEEEFAALDLAEFDGDYADLRRPDDD